jgi:hypothetical protein
MKPPEPATLFQDTFDDPAFGGRWDMVDVSTLKGPAQWSVRKGILRQTSNCYTPGSHKGTMLVTRAAAAPPYRLRARLRSNDPDRLGVVFGYKDPDNLHLYWMSDARRDRALVRIREGSEERLAARRAGFQLSRWYDLDLLVTSAHLTLRIDGRPALDAPVDAPIDGRVGLYAHANQGLEVSRFSLTRPVGAPRRPYRLQWQVHGEAGRQTIVKIANVAPVPVWINATARDQSGQPVTPAYLNGMGGQDSWQRLGPGCSGTVILGPPMTRPGHGVCEITWRAKEPLDEPPLLVSAYASDQQGLGWMIPVTPC